MKTTHYQKTKDGKFKMRVWYYSDLIIDITLDELPKWSQNLKRPEVDEVESKRGFRLQKSNLSQNTLFDKLSPSLFK